MQGWDNLACGLVGARVAGKRSELSRVESFQGWLPCWGVGRWGWDSAIREEDMCGIYICAFGNRHNLSALWGSLFLQARVILRSRYNPKHIQPYVSSDGRSVLEGERRKMSPSLPSFLCFLPRHCVWVTAKAPDEARWTRVVAKIFWVGGLGSSGLLGMQGLGLSLSARRLAGISTTGKGLSWDTGSSATGSGQCAINGSWRHHSL